MRRTWVLNDAGWQRQNMSKNRLAVIPDQTHYDLFLSPRQGPTLLPFLDGKSAATIWAAQVK